MDNISKNPSVKSDLPNPDINISVVPGFIDTPYFYVRTKEIWESWLKFLDERSLDE